MRFHTLKDDVSRGELERTFGQAFGELIRTRRGQEGLTQKDLAIRAFDDESKVRRINDLETGAVNRPHAKTVDALVVALNIREEELANCQLNKLFTSRGVGNRPFAPAHGKSVAAL